MLLVYFNVTYRVSLKISAFPNFIPDAFGSLRFYCRPVCIPGSLLHFSWAVQPQNLNASKEWQWQFRVLPPWSIYLNHISSSWIFCRANVSIYSFWQEGFPKSAQGDQRQAHYTVFHPANTHAYETINPHLIRSNGPAPFPYRNKHIE